MATSSQSLATPAFQMAPDLCVSACNSLVLCLWEASSPAKTRRGATQQAQEHVSDFFSPLKYSKCLQLCLTLCSTH